jgi:hypothetical protein
MPAAHARSYIVHTQVSANVSRKSYGNFEQDRNLAAKQVLMRPTAAHARSKSAHCAACTITVIFSCIHDINSWYKFGDVELGRRTGASM